MVEAALGEVERGSRKPGRPRSAGGSTVATASGKWSLDYAVAAAVEAAHRRRGRTWEVEPPASRSLILREALSISYILRISYR